MNHEDEVSALREIVQQQQKRIAELEQQLLEKPEAMKEEWRVSPILEAVREAPHLFHESEKEEEEVEPFI